MTLGKAIKLVRTATGTKQRTLARKLEVSSNYLSLIENDKREPSIGLLTRLAKALGVPIGIFFLWQEDGGNTVGEGRLDRIRDVLTRLEAMYLLAQRHKSRSKKKVA